MRSLALPLLVVLVVAFLTVSLTGCGTFAVGFISNPGSATGTVSSVHLSVINGDVQVTFVTLQNNGSSNQFAFCGDHVGQFPMNTSVTVRFDPGHDCNQIIVVITG